MIKKILVALDQDSDTPVATQYAIQIAKNTDAKLTGLAVVDTSEIESSSKGGGIGSFYYAEKIRESLTAETRIKARELIEAFERKVDKEGIDHVEAVEEGVSVLRIVEDMKYHDLLVVGMDPHFFYGHPNKDSHTLAGIFKRTIGPSLIVPTKYRAVKKVLFASDASNDAFRTLHQFVHLKPFGNDVEITVFRVHKKESPDVELQLSLTKKYLEAHGFKTKVVSQIDKEPDQLILDQAASLGSDLIISGGTAHTGLLGTKFGKTTEHLVNNSTIPLFMGH